MPEQRSYAASGHGTTLAAQRRPRPVGHRDRPGLLSVRFGLLGLLAVLGLSLASVAPARAQDGSSADSSADASVSEDEARRTQARERFAEGVAHTQAQEWDAAVASFTAALELHPAPAIRHNLAAALVEVGRYRDAAAQLALVRSDPSTPANLLELVEELEGRIQREAGRISIERSSEIADASVSLDAEPLEEEWLARQIPVARGEHIVTAERRGEQVASTRVSVLPGEHTRVVLAMAAGEERPDTPPPERPITEEWGFWVAVGAGAVVLVSLAVIVGVASADNGPSEPVPGNFNPGLITWP